MLVGQQAFYRAMHYNAKRGLGIACRLSVHPSVCLSVTLMDCDDIQAVGWNSSKIISPLVSLGCSLSADPNMTGVLQGEHPKKFPPEWGGVRKKLFLAYKSSNISETRQDRTKVSIVTNEDE